MAAADAAVTDALSLLTRDHGIVAELFGEFEQAAEQQLDPLARRICKMLRIHTQIEEEIFYPAARRALQEDALVNQAEQEHRQARQVIAELESITAATPGFREQVAALAGDIRRHVEEEETQLFPALRDTSIDLVALGVALTERREVLMEVLGLHDDDEEGAANQRQLHDPDARLAQINLMRTR